MTNETSAGPITVDAPPDPGAIPLQHAVDWIQTHAPELIDSMGGGQQCIWTGSPISGHRVPDLGGLLHELVQYLDSHADRAHSQTCPYLAALRTLLTRFNIRDVNLEVPLTQQSQDTTDFIVQRLLADYAKALHLTVETSDASLRAVYDILNIPERYAESSGPPDAEHRLLALLFREHAVTHNVTANWDTLFEQAVTETLTCGTHTDVLRVVAGAHDLKVLQPHGVSGTLLKVHGCAQKTSADPQHYSIVATEEERAYWGLETDTQWFPVREELRTIIRSRPVLLIGFSAGDYDLRNEFHRSLSGLRGVDDPVPRVRIADDSLTYEHTLVLQAFYSDQYSQRGEPIRDQSLIPMFSKPVLGALYHCAILGKAEAVANCLPHQAPLYANRLADTGVTAIDHALKRYFSTSLPADEAWREYAYKASWWLSRCVTLARGDTVPDDPRIYAPFYELTASNISQSPHTRTTRYPDFLIALGIIYLVLDQYSIELEWCHGEPTEGHARLFPESGERRVFLLLSTTEMQHLVANGYCDPLTEDGTIVIYSSGSMPHTRRSYHPQESRRFPVRRPEGVTEIYMQEILYDEPDYESALQRVVDDAGVLQ